MLVIKVELHHAVTHEVSELGRMTIFNDGTGSHELGNYHAEIDDDDLWTVSRVTQHPRAHNVWTLVRKALNAMLLSRDDDTPDQAERLRQLQSEHAAALGKLHAQRVIVCVERDELKADNDRLRAELAKAGVIDGAACTCGSGGHPRACAKHPRGMQEHADSLSLENLRDDNEHLRQEVQEWMQEASRRELHGANVALDLRAQIRMLTGECACSAITRSHGHMASCPLHEANKT